MEWMNQTVELDIGETISYFDTKTDGKTLLFIHGNLVGGYIYKGIEDYFPDDYRIIVLSLPGFGKSSYNRRCRDYETWAEDVISFINALNLKKVHLIGVEGGTAIIQCVAAKAPELVESIHLISPVLPQGRSFHANFGNLESPSIDNPIEFRQHPIYGVPFMKALVEGDRDFFKRILTMTYYYIQKPDKNLLTTELDAIFSNRAYFDALSALAKFNITSEARDEMPGNNLIKSIQAPIFIYYGNLNRYLSSVELNDMMQFYKVPPVLTTYDKSGTLIFHDEPEAFFEDFNKNINSID